MTRFALLILLCLIIWGFWMTWEWLRNRDKTPIVPNPNKKDTNNKLNKNSDEESI